MVVTDAESLTEKERSRRSVSAPLAAALTERSRRSVSAPLAAAATAAALFPKAAAVTGAVAGIAAAKAALLSAIGTRGFARGLIASLRSSVLQFKIFHLNSLLKPLTKRHLSKSRAIYTLPL